MNKELIPYLFLLFVALLAVSSAGTVFDLIEHTSGSLKASWRLQVTSLAQIPLFVFEYKAKAASFKVYFKTYWWLVLISGISLGAHFSLWATSLMMTSLARSLTFVSCTPILVLIGQVLIKKKPSLLQTLGGMITFGGLLLISLGPWDLGSGKFVGDMLAFGAAVAVTIYIFIGKFTREFELLWTYLLPVNSLAAISSYIFAISLQDTNPSCVVEWMYTENLLYVLYLGLVPGILGHASLNFLVKVISPLLIGASINLEPVIGSFIGWCVGIQGIPNLWVWVGGAVIILGNVIVTIAERPEEKTHPTQPSFEEELL